jgi:hypothetical protein
LTRHGGGERKDAGGAQAEGSPLAIVLGSVLDDGSDFGATRMIYAWTPVARGRGALIRVTG